MQNTKWSIDCRMQAARSIQSRKIIVVDNKNTAKARDIFLAKSAKMLIFFLHVPNCEYSSLCFTL